jgi:membrane-bound lytic murein transglycosylase B
MLIKMILKILFAYCLVLYIPSTFCHAAEKASYLEKATVQAFIQEMEQKHQLTRDSVEALLKEANHDQIVLRNIKKPAENLEWKDYERLLIKPNRVAEGIIFWKKHDDILRQAETKYGVPAKIIVAILGIETNYGSMTGHHRVLDALATLSFDYPPRSAFFRQELAQFLLLAKELKVINPLMIKGSYAGAIGIPQFMPSSYRCFAVDSDNKGYSNLIDNTKDAIFSVAHYLQKNGWIKQAPVILPAYILDNFHPSKTFNKLIDNQILQSIDEWKKHHIDLVPSIKWTSLPLAQLIKLNTHYGWQYWFAFHNFSVIKTYNKSILYSMAVYKLSELLEDGYNTSR